MAVYDINGKKDFIGTTADEDREIITALHDVAVNLMGEHSYDDDTVATLAEVIGKFVFAGWHIRKADVAALTGASTHQFTLLSKTLASYPPETQAFLKNFHKPKIKSRSAIWREIADQLGGATFEQIAAHFQVGAGSADRAPRRPKLADAQVGAMQKQLDSMQDQLTTITNFLGTSFIGDDGLLSQVADIHSYIMSCKDIRQTLETLRAENAALRAENTALKILRDDDTPEPHKLPSLRHVNGSH